MSMNLNATAIRKTAAKIKRPTRIDMVFAMARFSFARLYQRGGIQSFGAPGRKRGFFSLAIAPGLM